MVDEQQMTTGCWTWCTTGHPNQYLKITTKGMMETEMMKEKKMTTEMITNMKMLMVTRIERTGENRKVKRTERRTCMAKNTKIQAGPTGCSDNKKKRKRRKKNRCKKLSRKNVNDERNGSRSCRSWLKNRRNENRSRKLMLRKDAFYRH